MENHEDDIILQTHDFKENTNYDPEETIHVLTPRNSSNQSRHDLTQSLNDESNTKTKYYKILNGSSITKSTNKEKIDLQSIISPPQKKFIEFKSPTKKAIINQNQTKSDFSPSLHGTSQLRISGQKVVEESISLMRPMKCCNYDVPDIIFSAPINPQKLSFRSDITATGAIMRRQQLQEQRMKKIRMLQQNMIAKNPDRLVTQEDMKQIKKGIDLLERKQKMTEEAKKKKKNIETQNPYFINLLPTGLL